MSNTQRPISPFMLGPYYKPQLTSVLSFIHRITGVVLSLLATPIALVWLITLASGPQAHARLTDWLSSIPGKGILLLCLFCLFYHFFNGIRHLVWDSGWWLELKSAYASGWGVLIASLVCTGVAMGVWL